MILKATDKFIDTSPIERLLTEGEKYSDVINFVLPKVNNGIDISDCIFTMRTVADTGEMTEGLLTSYTEDNNIIAQWYPSEAVTAIPGMLSLELIGSKGSERIIKYKMPAIYVKEAVMGEGLPVPDIIEEKLAMMNETLSQATELQKESETLHNESQDLQRRTEELAEQIVVSSEYVSEVTQARRSSFSDEVFDSLGERLDSDILQLDSAIQEALIIDNLEISGGIINSNRGNSIYDATGNRRGLLALGVGNTASGQYSVAMGGGNTASGGTSVAMGGSNNASDTYSVAIGGGNTASGGTSVAMGSNNTVSSSNSVAMGSSNTVSSSSSVAIGGGNKAFSSHSVAMGGGNTTSGSHSVAMGGGNTASGEFSVAMGVGNTASSMNSVAIGGGNKASGQYSVATGQSNTANVDNQTVIGRYNAPDSTEEGEVQHAFIIGNGNSTESGATHLSNAMTVDWDGNLIMSGDVTATDTNKETISLLNIYNRLKNIEERLSALETT